MKGGADPGFRVGGGANPPACDFLKFYKTFHKVELSHKSLDLGWWTGGGHRPRCLPPIRHCEALGLLHKAEVKDMQGHTITKTRKPPGTVRISYEKDG